MPLYLASCQSILNAFFPLSPKRSSRKVKRSNDDRLVDSRPASCNSTSVLAIFSLLTITDSRNKYRYLSSASFDCSPAHFTPIQAGKDEAGGSDNQIPGSISTPDIALACIHSGPICPGFRIEFRESVKLCQEGSRPAIL